MMKSCFLFACLAVGLTAGAFETDSLKPFPVTKPVPEYLKDEHRAFQSAPSVTISRGGRLWCVWHTGLASEGPDNCIVVVSSGDGGKTWTKPLFSIDAEGPLRVLDPGLWTDPDGKVWLFYSQLYEFWDGRAGVWAMHPVDPDRADTDWTPARRLCDGYLKNKPLVKKDGAWLLPVEFMHAAPFCWTMGSDYKSESKPQPMNGPEAHPMPERTEGANVYVSRDKGLTVSYLGQAFIPKKDRDCPEHMLTERADGSLRMLVRTRYGIGEAFSSDGGKSWSQVRPSAVRNPSSRFFIGRLASGALLLVKNGPVTERIGRDRMMAFVSDDDGATWTGGLVLDARKAVSYPDVVQGADGLIHVVHDRERIKAREILHHVFTEADVRAGKLISSGSRLGDIVNKALGKPLPADEIPAWKPEQVKSVMRPDAGGFHVWHARRHTGIASIAVSPKNGRLWAVWYGGPWPGEDRHNFVSLVTSGDDGKSWKEVLVADPDGEGPLRSFDPQVWVSPDGQLRVFWTEALCDSEHQSGYTASHVLKMATFPAEDEPTELPQGRPIARGVMMGKPIVLDNGEWLFPVAHWYQEPSGCFLVSADGGRTFRYRGGVTIPKEQRGVEEHYVVQNANGDLVTYLRGKWESKGEKTHPWMSVSKDRGKTWTPAEPAPFAHTSSRAALTKLRSGNWLLVKHGRLQENNGRRNLFAYLSRDEGATWEGGLPIAGGLEWISYPDADQKPDGRILVIYDFIRTGEDQEISYDEFTEADVLAGKDVSGKCRFRNIITRKNQLTGAEPPAEEETKRIEREAFERFADLAVKLPPVIRTENIAGYSTNKLDFALNNGLAMTRGGRIWANWIAGGDSSSSFTVGSWSDDGGETWTDVNFVIDGHNGTISGRTNIIGTYWLDPDGLLHCFTDQSMMHYDGRAGVWEAVCRNPDDAKPVWSAFRRIGDGHVINKPIVLKDGTWLLAAYNNGTWNDRKDKGSFPEAFANLVCTVSVYGSTDKGKTWRTRGKVKFPGFDWQEAQLLELRTGTVRLFARVNEKVGEERVGIMCADSTDGGWKWSKPVQPQGLKHANSRFQIQRLQSGNLLLVKHGVPDRNVGRNRLTAYISDDDGKTWKGGLVLSPGTGSYPDAFQAPDGLIYVSHDNVRWNEAEIWLHRFTEEDVLAGKIVSPRGKLNLLVSRAMASKFNQKRYAR